MEEVRATVAHLQWPRELVPPERTRVSLKEYWSSLDEMIGRQHGGREEDQDAIDG